MSRPFDPKKLPDKDFDAPDPTFLVNAVEGWRAWHVARQLPSFGVAPRLQSVSHSHYYWSPRKFSQADCYKCGDDVPGENCSCGFYSAKTLKHLLTMGYPGYHLESDQFAVVGQIANWGKVIEASSGWRSQKAYPVRLWVPYECWRLAKPIEEAYGVPVRLGQWLASALDKALAGEMPMREKDFGSTP